MNSKRLVFNHYTEADFDDYFLLVSNADVMKMVTGRPDAEADARKRLKKMLLTNKKTPNIGHFKVSLKCDGSFVGHSKLEMKTEDEAEIGYLLMPKFWAKGYGSEIAETLVKRSKEIENIHSLIAIIDPENMASKRILEKQGFLWDYDGEYIGLPAAYYKMNA